MNASTRELLRNSSFLQFLNDEQFERVLSQFSRETYDYAEPIVEQGKKADAYFIITNGRARVLKETKTNKKLVLGSLRAGSEFGESALLNEEERSATVRCSTPVVAYRLGRDQFLKLVEDYPQLRERLETTIRARDLSDFIYQFSNFGKLPARALRKFLEELKPVTFAKGETIIRQGDPAGPMYVVHSGKIKITVKEDGHTRTARYLRESDFLGEKSILDNSPRTATAEALTDCNLLSLSGDSVRALSEEFIEFKTLIEERLSIYERKTEARIPLDFTKELLPAEAASPVDDESTESDKDLDSADNDKLFADEKDFFNYKGNHPTRKIPFIRQISEMDCGAAALAMICRYHGRRVSLARINQLCHTSKEGTSLSALRHAASELGLEARSVKVSPRNLKHMPLPAIVHWGGNHWVVLYSVAKKYVKVADPAKGYRKIPVDKFQDEWTGYSALFDYDRSGESEKSKRFKNAPEEKSSMAWLWPFFKRFRGTLVQALLLSLITSSLVLLFPVFTQIVTDKVIVDQDLDLLTLVLAGLLISQGFVLSANLLQQYLLSFVTVKLDSAILDHITRYLLGLPMSYFTNRRTGDIQRRLDGARQIRTFIVQQALGGLLAVVQLFGSMILMGLYSIRLLCLFLLTAPLYAGLMYFSKKVLRPIYAELEESQANYSSAQIDAIKGIEAVKAAAAEQNFRDNMLNEFLSLANKRFKGGFRASWYQSGIQGISLLNGAIFLWFGAQFVIDPNVTFTIGSFVAFNTLIVIASTSIMRSLGMWDGFQSMSVLMNRLNDVFEQEPEQGHDRSRLIPVPSLEGRIEFQNVSFRYGGPNAPNIIDNLSFEIAPGRTVAIVGRSGCGKTTLIKLIAGLLEPSEGKILFDGTDSSTLNYKDLRRKIGMVLQDNHMFSDTVARNIAFGDPQPDENEVMRFAELAAADEFIMGLPSGYETKIGESGLSLSGGQQQRISIARALYNDPPILIFDEATSALDTESERAIQSNMRQFMANRTSIVIAHRLSTIREADHIIVLEKGEIAEEGTHDELRDKKGLYFHLSSQQLGGVS